ncbi:uncharacterized protein LOC114324628 [Diabrotica virgifera virgifera]|uniref:Uncharacterized protein LOC114324628 n=1 Tax=Diabrotica virgifera virgifera TaxID=50390 RepID=A0A6P7F0B8_DIAVI|nr:uncharacterized protein LOC114324628 [Diabrotica virgifera virgifera]
MPSVPKSSRPMKFPYTFTAKLVQFPYKHYFKHNWIYRYYVFGVIASLPIFMYLSRLAHSPGNVEQWKEIRRKEEEEQRHKFA